MVLTLVPVIKSPWITSGDAKRSVTRRFDGTAIQRGRNMNCVAMARTVTLPSAATLVPRLCSANSPERCSALGSTRSTLLGGLTPMVSAVNRIVLRAAATNTPTPKAHSSSVRRIHCSCISGGAWDIRLSYTPARNKDEQIDQQISEHQKCDSRSSKHGCAQRYRSHHARECRFVNLINFVQLRIFYSFRLHPDSPSGEFNRIESILRRQRRPLTAMPFPTSKDRTLQDIQLARISQ